ncbi:MAG: helix-turn-helix domain-containing protein [Actinomycetaceae bacterium]
MEQQEDLDSIVRGRLRALRIAQGMTLGELAERARMSQSTLSRLESGQRRLVLDQVDTLARALDTTVADLVDQPQENVVSTPTADRWGNLLWSLRFDPTISVVRQRYTEPPPAAPSRLRAHSGREWLVVLSGTAILKLGGQSYTLEVNQAAEFPTMMPHGIGAASGVCEVLGIFDRDARRGHHRRRDPGPTV